ncbi:mesoderm induction early response protein 1-like [Ptychodera flava]|uniref:mesoderm induction early response protein 1-like n=1 Tax=Ptychodera flava TaxID=63121 RepID=UPI00396A7B02
MAEPATSESSPDTDRDFDPSAEMLIHDFDDERTMEEEEQLDSGESCGNELDDLEKESEMPLEHLLAMYGYESGPVEQPALSSEENDIQINTDNLTLDKEQIARDLLQDDPDENGESSNHEELTRDLYDLVGETSESSEIIPRPLRSNTMPDSGSESDDSDYEPQPYDDWKKEINIGSYYQAEVPEGLSKYDDAPAYENEDRLLWDHTKCDDERVEEYLRQVQEIPAGSQGVKAIPTGNHIRDDEQALYLLLQCGHNLEEALRRHRMQVTPPTDEMSLWSEDECRSFENGLRTYGKDFHMIQQHKVRTRSVGELVQFYYLWKKTERHDTFANQARLSKPKYKLHPGITDYMDRFLDDSETNTASRSVSPHSHLLNRPLFLKPSSHSMHHASNSHHHHLAETSTNTIPSVSEPAQATEGSAANGHHENKDSVESVSRSCAADTTLRKEHPDLDGPSDSKRFKTDTEVMFMSTGKLSTKSIQHNHIGLADSTHQTENAPMRISEMDSIRGIGTATVASINALPEGLLTSGALTQTTVTSSEPISQ